MISRVRETESLEEVAALQHEADGILRETLECYEDGAIEEGDLSAFGLVMEQFHHAVVEHRMAISGTASEQPRMRAL